MVIVFYYTARLREHYEAVPLTPKGYKATYLAELRQTRELSLSSHKTTS
jgi:hypothetical protein